MKTLIVYFSVSGKTKKAAEHLADITGGDIYSICSKVVYPGSFLKKVAVAKREFTDRKYPKLVGDVENFREYDRILIGFPIWCGTCPMAVSAFMKKHDFTGKEVFPFCTSGSSGIRKAVQDISADCEGELHEGLRMNKVSEEDIIIWLS
ncbi:MAG: flavodoxin [Ruminococcus sp.]|nr:flavodoxin [Ruminococcus sp.]